MTRVEYMHDLENLQGAVVAMSSMVDKAISRSIDALMRQDVIEAQEVISEDRGINRHRWATEEDALRLIATQGPMAKDLRNIAAAIHIVTDLERMADHRGRRRTKTRQYRRARPRPRVHPEDFRSLNQRLPRKHTGCSGQGE